MRPWLRLVVVLFLLALALPVEERTAATPTDAGVSWQSLGNQLVAFPGLTDATTPTARASFKHSSSAIAATPDGRWVLAVNPDSSSVSLIAADTRTVLAELTTGHDPRSVAVDANGGRAYVANMGSDTVSIVDIFQQPVVRELQVGDEPYGVVIAPDGRRVYVANSGSGNVSAVDAATGELIASIPVEDNPRGLAITEKGNLLYVTHFFTGRVSVIDTATLKVVQVFPTFREANLSQSIVISPSGTRAYLPQTRSNVTNADLQFDSIAFPIVSAVDLKSGRLIRRESITLDTADRPVNRPFDAAVSPDGELLYVVNAGSDDVSVVDLATGLAVTHIEVEDNPRGIALSPDGGTAYVNNTLAGTVSVIDTALLEVVDTVKVTRIPSSDTVLLGKRLFESSDRGDMARDQWVSCATCHPDGEMDRRVWLFSSGPRNTISLLGVSETLPITWSQERDEIQDNEFTIRDFMQGTGLIKDAEPHPALGMSNAGRSAELDALAAFVESLEFPPNSYLNPDGTLSEQARRGREVFTSLKTRCLACHVPPLYTDRTRHDVGTGESPAEHRGPAFDTPSLRGLYRTAPYLHDGSAPTLREVLTTGNPEDRHGVTSHLTEVELEDLESFLRSLPFDEGRDVGVLAKVFALRSLGLLGGRGSIGVGMLLVNALWVGGAAALVAALVLYGPYRRGWLNISMGRAVGPGGLAPIRGYRGILLGGGLCLIAGVAFALAYAVVFEGILLQPSWVAGAALGGVQWIVTMFAAGGVGLTRWFLPGKGRSRQGLFSLNAVQASLWSLIALLVFGAMVGALYAVDLG